ncbi:MAG: hypothetical protein ACI308_04400 [Muribaculaceae bacterium]
MVGDFGGGLGVCVSGVLRYAPTWKRTMRAAWLVVWAYCDTPLHVTGIVGGVAGVFGRIAIRPYMETVNADGLGGCLGRIAIRPYMETTNNHGDK